jgi:collagen type III alpha
MRSTLPDILLDALGQVVAEVRSKAQSDLELVIAHSETMIAKLQAKIMEMERDIQRRMDVETERVNMAIAKIKDGEPGLRGEQGPPGEKGERGEPGEKGEPGPSGEKGDIGERGQQGEPGRDGRDGLNGLQGERGDKGIDGNDGINGKNGRDGLGFDEMEPFEDECTFGLTFKSGDQIKKVHWSKPSIADRHKGVWREGEYQRGDTAQQDGSIFLALRDTKQKPGMPDSGWLLVVKRGQHGKDGKDGKPGAQGPEGRPGRDLTQLGPDGKKW